MGLNVSLTPELEAFISSKVQSGNYTSASEVVREGLRLLRDYDELRAERLECELMRSRLAGLGGWASGHTGGCRRAHSAEE